jgi:hypothetical protein
VVEPWCTKRVVEGSNATVPGIDPSGLRAMEH